MIISFKNGEKVLTMENADMRSICGGTAVATQSFLVQFMKVTVLYTRKWFLVLRNVQNMVVLSNVESSEFRLRTFFLIFKFRNMLRLIFLFLLILAHSVSYGKKYTLSETPNGLCLKQWLGKDSVIDFNSHKELKKVKIIGEMAFEKNNHIKKLYCQHN